MRSVSDHMKVSFLMHFLYLKRKNKNHSTVKIPVVSSGEMSIIKERIVPEAGLYFASVLDMQLNSTAV